MLNPEGTKIKRVDAYPVVEGEFGVALNQLD